MGILRQPRKIPLAQVPGTPAKRAEDAPRKEGQPLGKAVELSGLSYWDFIEFLSESGVAVLAHDEVNLEREFEAAQELLRELKKNEGCM